MAEQPTPVLSYARPRERQGYGNALLRAIGTTLVAAVTFGVGGACLGMLIGLIAPGYYRAVFGNPADPAFSPVAIGFALAWRLSEDD